MKLLSVNVSHPTVVEYESQTIRTGIYKKSLEGPDI
jgi:hypothetical protein